MKWNGLNKYNKHNSNNNLIPIVTKLNICLFILAWLEEHNSRNKLKLAKVLDEEGDDTPERSSGRGII